MTKKQSFPDWEAKILREAQALYRYKKATRGLTLDPGERIAATARAKQTSEIDAALRDLHRSARTKSKNQGPRRKK